MAIRRDITLTRSTPSAPRPLSPAEVNALPETPDTTLGSVGNQKATNTMANVSVNTTDHPAPTPPSAPNKGKPKGNASQAQAKANPTPTTSDNLPTEAEIAQLMPYIPAESRNNPLVRLRGSYYLRAKQLGATNAQAGLTLIALAESAVDGAIERALAPSDKFEHAMELYSAFQSARAKVAPQTEDTIKNKARQLNWMMRLGSHYQASGKKWFNDMVDLHNNTAASPADLKNMKFPAVYEDIINLTRKQMMAVDEADDNVVVPLMTAAEARQHLFKELAKQKDATALLIAAYKTIDNANEGKKENATKGIPARPGLKSAELIEIMKAIKEFVDANMSTDDKAEFFKETMPKKKGRTMAAPPVNPNTLTQGTAQPQAAAEGPSIPPGFYETETGEVVEIPEGFYLDDNNEFQQIPEGMTYDYEVGALVPEPEAQNTGEAAE